MSQNIAVIIPVYNETENILLLVDKIFKNILTAKIILIDDSPKEEATKLRRLIKDKEDKILIISRFKKLGRGNAVIAGFKEGLKDKKVQYFFEMDADLAHNPKEFKIFLKKIHGADLVIGSRYLSGSKIVKWPAWRLILSRFVINTFLKIWLGLDLSDYTNGFRLYNRRAVEFIMKAGLRETGFISLSEIAYKLKKSGFKISEIPTSFVDRKYGKSNAGIHELIKSLIGAIRIKMS